MIDNALNRTRVLRGSQLPHAKLDEKTVADVLYLVEIREQHKRQARALTNARIAEKLGVHRRTIDRITAGESWIHVKKGG